MAHPVNPPVGFYMARYMLHDVKLVEPGIWKSEHTANFFFWEPPRTEQDPKDWLAGPYTSLRAARRRLKKFIENEGEGPEVRTWFL